MISLDEALQKIDEAVTPLPPKKVPLLRAVGCCLSEEITAEFNVPDFASSAMDGIALAHSDLIAGELPVKLIIQGVIPAGKPASEPLKPEHAFRIMTGAPLPEGADTVIKVEELQFEGDSVVISALPGHGDHVRPVGNDIQVGEVVFPAGYSVKPLDAGIFASLGLTEISVYPRPSITVLATGSEIRSPGEDLQPGQIYNSNDTTLRSLLKANGFSNVNHESPVIDKPEVLTPVLKRLCKENDVVITSGAVSAGKFDFIPEVVAQLGGKLLFHKVAIKPGKPTLIARIGECWLLALPGNPVSVAVTYHLYGKRLLSRLSGHTKSKQREKANLTKPLSVGGNRFQVAGAFLKRRDGKLFAEPVTRYSSGRLSSIRGIDGFIFVPGGTREIPADSEVEVEWL